MLQHTFGVRSVTPSDVLEYTHGPSTVLEDGDHEDLQGPEELQDLADLLHPRRSKAHD